MKKIIYIDQYLFKLPPKPSEVLQDEIDKMKKEVSNLRKGLFKRFDELNKEIQNIKSCMYADMKIDAN